MTITLDGETIPYAEAKEARREAMKHALAINPPAPGVEYWTARYWAIRAAMEVGLKTREAA